jgi:LmbE family N-acetylglucosaminyl deacetylase
MGVVVLSPHLDDAVLSCFWDLMSGARVITVYAGVPNESARASGWDRACGFDDPREHVRARLAEDEMIMGELGVASARWGFCEYQNRTYGPRPSILQLTHYLKNATDDGDTLLAPVTRLSPSPHPDHEDVRTAAIQTGRHVRLYGDLPHCLKQIGEWPDVVGLGGPPGPKAWRGAAPPVAVHRLGTFVTEAKAAAMRAYATQFKPLGRLRDQPSRRVLRRPEVYGVEVKWEAP